MAESGVLPELRYQVGRHPAAAPPRTTHAAGDTKAQALDAEAPATPAPQGYTDFSADASYGGVDQQLAPVLSELMRLLTGFGSPPGQPTAAAPVASGACETVLIWRAINQGAAYRYGQPQAGGMFQPGSGTSSLLWCMPFGAQAPATWAALAIQRYMHEFGVTNRDFGRIAVLHRKHAATNPAAIFHGKPITLEEHQASRWIVEPVLRLLDCCQENAGAAAAVITTLERARDLRSRPVRIVAGAQSIPREVEVISNYYHDDLTTMPEAQGVARRLWAQSGLGPRELQVALLYDAFTPNVMKQLEAFGFCKHGEAKDFVADGHCELAGSIPTNTHGGHGGEAYIHGMNLLTEGVRQLRGTAANQVAGARHVLVSSGMAGAILARD